MEKVYIVQYNWSTFDDKKIELFVFDSFEKAYQKYQSLIADKLNSDNSWIGQIDWEDEQVYKRYEFFNNKGNYKNKCPYFYITDLYNPEMYTYIDLFSKKIL